MKQSHTTLKWKFSNGRRPKLRARTPFGKVVIWIDTRQPPHMPHIYHVSNLKGKYIGPMTGQSYFDKHWLNEALNDAEQVVQWEYQRHNLTPPTSFAHIWPNNFGRVPFANQV